jgi:hypothetical protein
VTGVAWIGEKWRTRRSDAPMDMGIEMVMAVTSIATETADSYRLEPM